MHDNNVIKHDAITSGLSAPIYMKSKIQRESIEVSPKLKSSLVHILIILFSVFKINSDIYC